MFHSELRFFNDLKDKGFKLQNFTLPIKKQYDSDYLFFADADGATVDAKINIISNTPVWVPLGSTANKEGRVAAVNLCGGTEDFEGILGSAVTRYLDLNISMTGLSEKNAQKLGFDTVSVIITKKDKAGYMPEVENITLKLVVYTNFPV